MLVLEGTPCIDLERHAPDWKTVMASRSFVQAVRVRREMEDAVSTFTARATEKMRRKGLVATSLVVFVPTNSHNP